ncbi:MAG: cyclic nucleotide-binding domain-containing protein [Candidatus Limnocylindrales bacterium]
MIDGRVESVGADDHGGLANGSRVAVIGGGPAGSLFTYFLLDMAELVDLRLDVDIYEPRLFARAGAVGCNMCGGIVSESLVQNLAVDGVFLSSDVIQRGIDSYVLHTDVGSVRIATPNDEMRIGTVHRGGGPLDVTEPKWESFDHHLLTNATDRGARVINARVEEVGRADGRPTIKARGGELQSYDLVVVATGVNTSILKLFEGLGIGYERPKLTKTLIREYFLGTDEIAKSLGTSMHVFLLNLPRLEFAAVIPKGDYVTMCLLGEDIDNELANAFATSPEVRAVMPAGWDPEARSCQCLPHINVRGVEKPYADRVVFIGDSGVTRLYKDGIGAAYRTAKAAARTAIFEGVSERDFHDHFLPVCRSIQSDNRIGAYAFMLTRGAQRLKILRRAIVSITRDEQLHGRRPRLSGVLWDIFSGSAPYSDIFRRMLDPMLVWRGAIALPGVLVATVRGTRSAVQSSERVFPGGELMSKAAFGRFYADGEIVARQGDDGDCMYVVQDGEVDIVYEEDGLEVYLRSAGRNEVLGEMAIFERQPRSATIRAKGRARILTLDKRNFLRRINEDPSLAFRMIETMSHRVRDLSNEVAHLKARLGQEGAAGVTEAD